MLRIAALILFCSAGSAVAETTWDVLQRFGYVGVWSVDCTHPPTRTNFFSILSKDPKGFVRRDVDRGEKLPLALSVIENAQLISPLTLKARIRNTDPNWGKLNNLTYDVVMIKEVASVTEEIKRLRVIESAVSDGRVIAKGGILLKLGKPTFWQYRCHNEVSQIDISHEAAN